MVRPTWRDIARRTLDAPAGLAENHAMIHGRYSPMPTSRKTIATLLAIAVTAGSAAAQEAPKPPGPAMMVHFDYYPQDRPRIHALEHLLARAIQRADAGELGETEIHVDGNDGYFYMYGPDPDRLYRVTSPILKASSLTARSEVTKWYGPRRETFVIR